MDSNYFSVDFDTVFLLPWMKLSWHSGSIWDKLGWLYWFWQFPCDSLSSFSTKGFYYSYASSYTLCEGRTSFAWDLSLENSADSYLCFQLILYLAQFLTSFSSINHLLCLYAWFLILFHLTEMMFSWSTHLLMFLLLETLMSFIRTS